MGITRHPLFTTRTPTDLTETPIDAELVRRLQISFERMSDPGARLAERFYDKLFARHPELRSMFPGDMQRQRQKLLATLRAVIDRLSHPQETLTALIQLGRMHAGLGVKPAHYPIVVEILVAALAEASAADWTPDLALDWSQTLALMSEAMIAASPPLAAQS